MSGISRRNVLKVGSSILAGAIISNNILNNKADAKEKSDVYFTNDLSGEGLKKVYSYINQNISGKIAIKVHTGEPKAPNIIPRNWVKSLTDTLKDATIVECNVYYGSPRQNTESHYKLLKENGWTFCKTDIMDSKGDIYLPVKNGKHFKEVAFGKSITDYDSMVVLTHFKGHGMGGFGGSLKNISVGCASGKTGKKQLHTPVGGSKWGFTGERFMENMVEAGSAITDYFGKKIVYINVLRNMSIDCDCVGVGADEPTINDMGILASTDILAIDQASVDMIYALPDKDKKDMVNRIESRQGLHQLVYMEKMGMGNRQYKLINV